MAISKSVMMRSGVTATYWKITNIAVDVQGLTTVFVLKPFLDQAHSDGQHTAVGPSKTYKFSVTEEQILNGSLSAAYQAILDKAETEIPNLLAEGTHLFDADLAGGSIV